MIVWKAMQDHNLTCVRVCVCKVLICMFACVWCTRVHGCGCMLWMSFILGVFLCHYLLCLLRQVLSLYLDLIALVSLTSQLVQANHSLQCLRIVNTRELPHHWGFSSWCWESKLCSLHSKDKWFIFWTIIWMLLRWFPDLVTDF